MAQRRVSDRKQGCRNRRTAVLALQRQHERIANRRKDCLHTLAHHLITRSDRSALDDHRITNMARNRRLATSILDAGWSCLVCRLTSAAADAVRMALLGDLEPRPGLGVGDGMASRRVRSRIGGWIAAVAAGWIATIPLQRPS